MLRSSPSIENILTQMVPVIPTVAYLPRLGGQTRTHAAHQYALESRKSISWMPTHPPTHLSDRCLFLNGKPPQGRAARDFAAATSQKEWWG